MPRKFISRRLADRIRDSRQAADLTQEELSQITGIPQPMISNFERAVNAPSIPNLFTLARCLNASTDHLIGLVD